MHTTPLGKIKKEFTSRALLIDKLAALVDPHRGDEGMDAVKARLGGLTNRKLLRLYGVEQKVRERFGDKARLVAHILEQRHTAGHTTDEAYKTKIQSYTKAALLDLTRRRYGPKKMKLTAEQRLKAKHGRKQRERAASKLGTSTG